MSNKNWNKEYITIKEIDELIAKLIKDSLQDGINYHKKITFLKHSKEILIDAWLWNQKIPKNTKNVQEAVKKIDEQIEMKKFIQEYKTSLAELEEQVKKTKKKLERKNLKVSFNDKVEIKLIEKETFYPEAVNAMEPQPSTSGAKSKTL